MEHLIETWGVVGVFVLMIPESAGIVVPSEVVLLAAGVLAGRGDASLPLAVLGGTLGNLVGSLLLYYAGVRSRTFAPSAGSKAARGLARCDALLERHGDRAVFLARLMPLARSFVSLPAGRVGVPLGRFVVLTTLGCAIWSVLFVGAGALAGGSAGAISGAVRDATVAAVALGLVVWATRRRLAQRASA